MKYHLVGRTGTARPLGRPQGATALPPTVLLAVHREEALSAGHPSTWALITAGTCLEGSGYG